MPRPGLDLTLHINPKMEAELSDAMRLTGLSDIDDVVNNALSMFVWAAKEVHAKGNEVGSFDTVRKHRTMLSMPCLQKR